ncbi:MAG TPA: ComEA family DNA-binding protein [Marinospirillum sp.]|uniref:ComEA family DNA-binding protein n=1 Tax=Marinospirillum sp. TaxID=2183934 RepID=UPI002B4921A3|nr:ComEA family DNA-binding protein [Marinospirillum sp.]HKM14990.1 ComEA family DNA-binding protein [Marinospirillum sp.]
MQGNSIKSISGFFALFLLLSFSGLGLANEPANLAKIEQPTLQQSVSRINVNKASAEQLSTLPGIGPFKAKAIIDAREQKGGFTSLADLQIVKGIGEKTTARLEHLVSF